MTLAPGAKLGLYEIQSPLGAGGMANEIAGSRLPIKLVYAERSKTYAYSTVRDLGTLYLVEGLQ